MVHRIRGLSLLATLVIIAHAIAFIWHLFVAAKIPPGLPGQLVLFVAVAVNAAPVVGLTLLLLRIYRLAAVLIFLPMALMLVLGAYEHFLSFGPNSVFDIPDSEWAWSFRVSAILLVILELLGCWIGVRSWSLQLHTQISASRCPS